jgi:polyisoprenoid-binding protein YceI
VEGNVAPNGDSQVVLKGILRLHGSDHEVMLPTQVHIAGGRMTADATVPIPYVKWGLKNPSTFILRVSEILQVHLHVSGSFTAASTARTGN